MALIKFEFWNMTFNMVFDPQTLCTIKIYKNPKYLIFAYNPYLLLPSSYPDS